ncbi:MAG: polysaccharide deacetylase family protein [Gemmatimonadota bacterium]|nr:polysaccharide deacetylase family protein [Gemmatimonadota bacterium]
MAQPSARRTVLAVSVLGGIVLILLGLFVWRSMRDAEGASVGENSTGYEPPTDIPSVLPAPSLRGVRVAVIEEPNSGTSFAPGFYRKGVRAWRDLLTGLGAEMVEPAGADVLVLPHVVCMGVGTRALVNRHLERGKGIVTSGLVGAGDQDCVPVRDTLLVSLTGGGKGSVARFKPYENDSYYAVVLGETALGAGLPPGARFEMPPGEQIVFRGADRAVLYTDYRRTPVPNRGEPYFDGAVVRSRVGRGRVVAFGFSPGEVVPGWSTTIVRGIVTNAVTWAAGDPVVQLAPWPEGYRAAAVVAQDVEADFTNASAAVDVLREAGIPGTFFLVGKLAKVSPGTTWKMVRYGEIGTHTFDHGPLEVLSDPEQREQLRLSKETTERLAGRPVVGLRPPEERFNLQTLRIWAELGGEYVFASNNNRSAGPEIVPYGPDSLVLLPRVVDDDFEVLNRSKERNRGAMTWRLLEQVEDVVAFRGVYMFSYHSHMFSQPDLLPVVRAFAKGLKEVPGIWITQAGEVARWWRARAAVRVDPAADGSSVELTSTGTGIFEGGVLLVDLPSGQQRRLSVPPLAPGASVRMPLPAT